MWLQLKKKKKIKTIIIAIIASNNCCCCCCCHFLELKMICWFLCHRIAYKLPITINWQQQQEQIQSQLQSLPRCVCIRMREREADRGTVCTRLNGMSVDYSLTTLAASLISSFLCVYFCKTEDRVGIARGGSHNCIFGIVLADSMQFRQMALATCHMPHSCCWCCLLDLLQLLHSRCPLFCLDCCRKNL